MMGWEHLTAEGKVTRTAENTRLYASAARDLCQGYASDKKVGFLDFWTIIMKKVGWEDGDPLIGRMDVGKKSALGEFLADGEFE